jgi:TadE-like protein
MRPTPLAGTTRRPRLRAVHADDRGAAVIEMAVISTVLMTMVLGIISFGITHHQNISIEGAAREASRFGATYPIEDAGSMEEWLRDVAQVAESAAIGAIGPTDPSRLICVAQGTGGDPGAFARISVVGAQPIGSATEEVGWCFENTAPPDDTVVQVQLEREGWIETIVFSMRPKLSAEATNRYERADS